MYLSIYLSFYLSIYLIYLSYLSLSLSIYLSGDNGLVERRGGSLNKEVEWRQWFSGTQGGEFK